MIDDADFVPGTTTPQGINNHNDLVGSGCTAFCPRRKIHDSRYPGARFTEAFNINAFRVVAGDHTDSNGVQGFTYHEGKYTTLDYAKAIQTFTFGSIRSQR